MTPNQKDQVVYLWNIEKSDTRSIAERLNLEEADVYNVLSQRIKAKLAASPGPRKVVIGWTPDEIAIAQKLAELGYSRAAIGKELGRTKNAVISRLRRKPRRIKAKVAA